MGKSETCLAGLAGYTPSESMFFFEIPLPKNIPGLLCWWVLPTSIVLMLAFPHIDSPFTGDQALYAYGGQSILNGELIYRDFVDIKHPGVHYYYALALLLFSAFATPEVSVHLLELVIWICFGLFVQQVLKNRLLYPALAALAPLALGGAYYATVGPGGLSQIEALPGPIICIGAWLACGGTRKVEPGVARSLLAGVVLAGVVVFHGHMIAVAIVIMVIAGLRHGNLAALISGFAACIAAIALLFVFAGGWAGLWDVYITYPFAAGDEVPAEPGGLMRVRWNISGYLYDFGPWVLLASFSVARFPKLLKDTFALQHLLWGIVALLTMLLETRTSWPFHFLYFIVPVGVLAVYGADALASFFGRTGRFVAVGAGLAALLAAVLTQWVHLADQHQAVTEVNARIHSETEFLRQADSMQGPVYVFGSPVYLKESGRRQALPRNGWGWEVALASHWNKLSEQLRDARPAYVYVSKHYDSLILNNAPDVMELLVNDYEQSSVNAHGKWYSLSR